MVLKRVLVTGATGVVGRHVRKKLESEGYDVAVSHRPSSDDDEDGFPWDLRKPLHLQSLLETYGIPKAIIHCGAMMPKTGQLEEWDDLFQANVRATLDLAKAAMAVDAHLITMSGMIVYPDDGLTHNEETPLAINTIGGFYGNTKLLADQMVQLMAQQGLRATQLRISSIYGDGLASSKIISKFLDRAAKNETIEIAPPHNLHTNFIHAADVARAVSSAIEAEQYGIYDLNGPDSVNIRTLAETCCQAVGSGMVVADTDAEDDAREKFFRFVSNSKKSSEVLGFQPQLSLSAGLKKQRDRQLL